MMTHKAQIKELSIKKIELNSRIGVLGPTHSGKTTIIDWLCYYNQRRIRAAMCISTTADLNGEYKYIPPILIHNTYKQKPIKNLIHFQDTVAKDGAKTFKDKRQMYQSVLILDDVMAEIKKYKSDTFFTQLFTAGRHSFMSIILACQDITQIPSSLRGCIEYLIIRKENQARRRKSLYDSYWNSQWSTYQEFVDILDKCTEGYKSMVIAIKNINKPGAKMNDCVFYLNLPDKKIIPEFRLGLDYIWEINDKSFNISYAFDKNNDEEEDNKHKKMEVSLVSESSPQCSMKKHGQQKVDPRLHHIRK
jgi:hypothetical protein